ncbi:MAG: hypothetical protein LBB87_03910 [Nitrososphaerota archaeon]|jgi:hypothetical protein|nr:hypothetical protein [Nitrososphaerota archaeon]
MNLNLKKVITLLIVVSLVLTLIPAIVYYNHAKKTSEVTPFSAGVSSVDISGLSVSSIQASIQDAIVL